MQNFQPQQNQSYGAPSTAHLPPPQANTGFSGALNDKRRWDSDIDWLDFPDRTVVTLRFFGPVNIIYTHWLETKTGKRFPNMCPGFDYTNQNFVTGQCPIEDDFNVPVILDTAKQLNPSLDEENDPLVKKLKALKARMSGLGHVIVRNAQALQNLNLLNKPWKPIRIPPSVFFTLQKLAKMNVFNIEGKTYTADITDTHWGRDVNIMYDSTTKNPSQRYTINMGNHTPLTDVEQASMRDFYDWHKIIEFSAYDDIKQSLIVNGYYQILNQLTNSGQQSFNAMAHTFGDSMLPKIPQPPKNMPSISMQGSGYQPPQQQSYQPQQGYQPPQPNYSKPEDIELPPPLTPPAQQPQQGYQPLPQQQVYQPPKPQQPAYQPPQQSYQQPQQSYQQPQQPQQSYQSQSLPEHIPTPPMAGMGMHGDGLVAADTHMATSIPQSAPPALQQMEEIEIPFGNEPRTFIVKGKPSGVNEVEFQKIVQDFSQTIKRGSPLKSCSNGEVSGLNVLNCFGSYVGDMDCVRCPLRAYCLHA